MNQPTDHLRALRAARAVTLGGAALAVAGCGTDPAGEDLDAGTDTTTDTASDTSTVPDTLVDTRVEPPLDTGADTGTDPGADTEWDTGVDTGTDTGTDADVDTSGPCSDTADDVCAASCTADNDYDCCVAQNDGFTWCDYSPEWGCSCAVEGPFAPPVFDR